MYILISRFGVVQTDSVYTPIVFDFMCYSWEQFTIFFTNKTGIFLKYIKIVMYLRI